MGTFLTAEWRSLAMLNYRIDPSLLADLVPAGTELDTFAGEHYVSVVGFMFLKTKVRGVPIPLHRNFEELNLRFYVRRKEADGWRRGVVFVRELVPRFAIAWVARTFYNENYISLPMRHQVAGVNTAYQFKHAGRWNTLSVRTAGAPSFAAPGSVEEFITEHYWGYARQRDGGTLAYEVQHPPWKIFPVAESAFDCDKAFYGAQFTETLSAAPASAFLADGSAITVKSGIRLAEMRGGLRSAALSNGSA